MGFIIMSEACNFYHSGDTSLMSNMQLIPKWAKLNFAVLPIGDNFTMDAADAATCTLQWYHAEKQRGKKVLDFSLLSYCFCVFARNGSVIVPVMIQSYKCATPVRPVHPGGQRCRGLIDDECIVNYQVNRTYLAKTDFNTQRMANS